MTVQLCIVHMARRSLNFVGWKERKQVAADLRRIYAAATVEQAALELMQFDQKWDARFALKGQSWMVNFF